MKIRTERPAQKPLAAAAPPLAPAEVPATTPPSPTTSPASPIPATCGDGVEKADGKRFDAHELPPPSTAAYQPQPGKRAALDLRAWQPSQLREAMLSDIGTVYDLLQKLPPAVTFFGGARIKEGDPYYAISQQIGALLAERGAPIRTGAGPGIMTAGPEGFKAALQRAPKSAGALDADTALHPVVSGMTDAVCATKTQGFRIKLPFEQEWSDSIDVGAEARLFPYRKLALYENCRGVAVFPGGYGTLDELFEVWAHGEAGKFHKPMAAVGTDFWKAVLDPIRKVAVAGQGGRDLIPAAEWQKLKLTDSPQDLVTHFEQAAPSTKVYEKPPLERARRLAREIDESIAVLDRLPMSVTFLGGRRLDDADPTLKAASTLAGDLAKLGVPLRVGSGGVVAEAVCTGAGKDTPVQGLLLGGLKGTRELPNLTVHQAVQDLVTHKEIIGRKSQAFVALPGGLNTLGEVFSVLTQIQTGHLPKIPVVLIGKDYWQPIFDALKQTMLSPERQTISPHDLDLVTIVDDPQEALQAMRPSLSSTKAATTLLPPETTAPQVLFEGERATMLNIPGQQLPGWLIGAPRGPNVIAADAPFDPALSRQFVVEKLKPALVQALDDAGADFKHVAWALDHGVKPETISALLRQGAGPETFRFLYACAPFSAFRSVGQAAMGIAARWQPHQEVVFRRLIELATSQHLQNPDAMKIWIEGLCAPGAAGDGFATMLGDAWNLVSAGHRIAIEEHAKGSGDIIDLDEGVVYQHKRVLSPHIAPALKKAAEQLLDAPPGMSGVVHLDLRNNPALNALGDDEIAQRVAQVAAGTTFASSRLDRIQLLLDTRLLAFDATGAPVT